MADDLTPRDVGPGPLDPVTDDRDGAPGTTKAASLDHALQHRKASIEPAPVDREAWGLLFSKVGGGKSSGAQVMTEQFHRSGLPAEVEVVDAAPEGVEPVKVVRS